MGETPATYRVGERDSLIQGYKKRKVSRNRTKPLPKVNGLPWRSNALRFIVLHPLGNEEQSEGGVLVRVLSLLCAVFVGIQRGLHSRLGFC